MMLLGILLRGGAKYVLTLTDATITHAVIDPADATAGVRFQTDGTLDRVQGATPTQINSTTDWVIPNNAAGTFHVKATEVSWGGAGTRVGTMGSWVELGTIVRNWYLFYDGAVSNEQWVIDIEISDDGGTTTIDTGRFTMNANVTV